MTALLPRLGRPGNGRRTGASITLEYTRRSRLAGTCFPGRESYQPKQASARRYSRYVNTPAARARRNAPELSVFAYTRRIQRSGGAR